MDDLLKTIMTGGIFLLLAGCGNNEVDNTPLRTDQQSYIPAVVVTSVTGDHGYVQVKQRNDPLLGPIFDVIGVRTDEEVALEIEIAPSTDETRAAITLAGGQRLADNEQKVVAELTVNSAEKIEVIVNHDGDKAGTIYVWPVWVDLDTFRNSGQWHTDNKAPFAVFFAEICPQYGGPLQLGTSDRTGDKPAPGTYCAVEVSGTVTPAGVGTYFKEDEFNLIPERLRSGILHEQSPDDSWLQVVDYGLEGGGDAAWFARSSNRVFHVDAPALLYVSTRGSLRRVAKLNFLEKVHAVFGGDKSECSNGLPWWAEINVGAGSDGTWEFDLQNLSSTGEGAINVTEP